MQSFSDVISSLKSQEIEYNTDVIMSEHTTFKIGGKAKLVIYPKNEKEICNTIKILNEKLIPFIFLGRCSNVLVSDDGITDKAVIKTDLLKGISVKGDVLTAYSGEKLFAVAEAAMKNGLSGFEFAAGIPGSAGGAIYMNAGATGGEISDIITRAVFVDEKGELLDIALAKSDFSYRKSIFMLRKCCIIKADFKLVKGDANSIRTKIKSLIDKRNEAQPLTYPSAGSVFKRPEGYYASALIDECMLKGVIVGGAQVSEKHAGFIINRENATCTDVLKLVELVKQTVLEKKGVVLETEIVFID